MVRLDGTEETHCSFDDLDAVGMIVATLHKLEQPELRGIDITVE